MINPVQRRLLAAALERLSQRLRATEDDELTTLDIGQDVQHVGLVIVGEAEFETENIEPMAR